MITTLSETDLYQFPTLQDGQIHEPYMQAILGVGLYVPNYMLLLKKILGHSHPITLHTRVRTHFVCWVQTGPAE